MIISIDISQIVYGVGVSRYTKELVRNLLRTDKHNHYKLFAGVWRQKNKIDEYLTSLTSEGLAFKEYITILPPQAADFIWNQLHVLSIESFIGNSDIVHTSNWAQPPSKAIKVTTVHDLTPVLYPQFHAARIISNFHRNMKWVSKECEAIIAVSKATKADLIRIMGIDDQRVAVVYSAADDKFQPAKAEEIDKVKNKCGISGNYILSVGTLEPRKNLRRVIEAFLSTHSQSNQLVLAGARGWGEEVPNNNSIIKTGFVGDDELPALYSGATAFIYVSEYEGFGLPIVEAMKCGCPVITSNCSSLPEVAGRAALLVDPLNTADIAKAINTVTNKTQVQREMKDKSLQQAMNFSWEKTAQETIAVYDHIGGKV